ncbi:MAG: glycerophosphodiester phosphodiesterase [Proteobacteria bacterium]|nr:glycerophosphodiester phosphodiesterase [Pseudomonadota bacterium]MBU1583571.1 glycerophosphodiester phosphodiesterase [Pseudomonadota bacterium]MBU2453263.1 glycerophosphodiester phosphodiesterase [Pseudomonadota bacterium]MBU2629994.1 glycerophosphodiester phosphodiesterase [Pseudomonadota bacterium]
MVQVIAHRGARSVAPENTMAAVKMAYDTGADLWETDVNTTCDGHLILFHDETLLRCTNAALRFPSRPSYRVREFSLAEIHSLDAGSFFVDTDPFSQILKGNIDKETLSSFKKETVPTLEQGLLFTKKMKWKINLELKRYASEHHDADLPDLTLDIIYRTRIPLNRVVISSFHHDWLLQVKKKEPGIEVQALVGDNDTDPLDFGDFGFPAYNANALLIDPDQIRDLKARGKKINLFTINDPETFAHFASLGVDGIFTDFPQRFAAKS